MKENQLVAFRIFYFVLSLSMLVMLYSCKKMIEVEPPRNQVISATAFSDDATAQSTLSGLYAQMMTANLTLANGGLSLYTGLAADEIANSFPNTNMDPFLSNALSPSLSVVHSAFWSSSYTHIYHANAILEGIEASGSLSPSLKQQLSGEAKFIRAFYYFYLVNLFGEVPLVTATDYEVNASLPRQVEAEVYGQVVADLQEAADLLPAAYPSTGRVRPNKWAAKALLARVYLYRKEWQKAEQAAGEVIASGTYSLPAVNAVFGANSSEAIWQLMPVGTSFNTSEGNTFIPASATVVPPYTVTSHLLDAFEAGDGRKTAWLKSNTVAGQPFFYPYKYKVKTGGAPYTEYNMALRLAEQYLIRAEAAAEQDKIPEAISALNTIRNRAGLPSTTANDKDSLLAAIEQERRVELFTEFGHRWLDLKRTGRIDTELGQKKPGWQPYDALFPVPQTELERNPFLSQNPGY